MSRVPASSILNTLKKQEIKNNYLDSKSKMEETINDGNDSKPTESKHHSLVPTYSLNERVFISEGKGKLYEASILKHNFKPGSNLSNGSFLYYIHYIGWNSRYDRWVSVDVKISCMIKISKSAVSFFILQKLRLRCPSLRL